jgi:site-specific DNA recombinase
MTTTLVRTDVARAGLYQRVSQLATAADRQTARSIEQQNEGNREACQRHGWLPVAEYADPGLSASRFAGAKGGANREHYWRALADVKAGRLDVLVLWEPSRGSRELENWAHLLNACRVSGVLIHVTSHDHTYDLAIGRDWRALAEDGIDSAYESEKLSMRILRGKADGKAAGRPQGAVAYGMRRIYDPQKRVHAWLRDEPHPDTAPVVAEIIRAVAAGHGYQSIADALNERGVPSPAGRQWTRSAVTSVAGREVYAAAGIVTEAESLSARGRLTDTRRKGERPQSARFRYSQVMTCGRCGGPVRGSIRSGADVYHCRAGCAYIPAAAADEFIDGVAADRLSRPDAEDLFGHADDAAVIVLRTEAERWRQKIADATRSYNADRITLDTLEAITADARPKAEAADRQAREAAVPSPLAGLPGGSRAAVAKRWDALSMSARKAATRALMPDLTLMPSGHLASAPVWQRIIPWPKEHAGE